MKNVIILAVAALAMTACAQKAATVTPPAAPTSPNIGVVVGLEGLALLCEISAADVDPSVAVWLSGPCPTAATGMVNVVEANGTVAQLQAVIDTMRAEAATIPSTAKGIAYVNQAIVGAQGVLNIYEAATGQPLTAADVTRMDAVKARLK